MNAFSAREYLYDYIEDSTPQAEALTQARESAAELGLQAPNAMTAAFLSTLARATQPTNAIAVTPAAGVVGLSLLAGMPEAGILSCIDPEPEHQRQAKQAFQQAGYRSTRIRFLPSRPLDVMERLAPGTYQFIYAEVPALELQSFTTAALPLLAPNGVLVLGDALLDGAANDADETDREVVAVREFSAWLNDASGVQVSRLPLGAGAVLLVKE